MVYGYVRVSSKSQEKNNSLDEQEQEILASYPNADIRREVFTAAKNFGDREVFNKVVADAKAGDVLVVCKMDRFCRSVREGLSIIESLNNKGVTVHILNLGLIDDSSIGKLLFTVLLAFAEFERNMIVERTKLGREVARQKDGYKEGRPPKFSKEQISLAMNLLESYSYKRVESMTGISKSTLQRLKNKQGK